MTSTAEGGLTTVTLAVTMAEIPIESVTVSVTVKVPMPEYVWVVEGVADGLDGTLPSPKPNAYVAMGLLPGVDVDPSMVTGSGTPPLGGVNVRCGVGGATAVTAAVALAEMFLLSVTMIVTV